MSAYGIRRKSRPAYQQVLHDCAQRDKQAKKRTLGDACRAWYQRGVALATKHSQLLMSSEYVHTCRQQQIVSFVC